MTEPATTDAAPDALAVPPEPPPPWPRRRRLALLLLVRTLLALAWVAIVVWSIRAGVEVREWAWRETAPIRFRFDVANAMRIGHAVNSDAVALADARAAAAGAAPTSRPAAPRLPVAPWGDVWSAYVAKYDRTLRAAGAAVRGREIPDPALDIDYPPGRLLVVTAWLRQVRDDATIDSRPVPPGRVYRDGAIGPMRRVNEAHELLAAAGAFALCRRALRNAGRSRLRATSLATLAALLLWFNPALILTGHGWPQWDAWVLPYAIWATYLALSDRWMLAGAAVALGAMFKGQTLLIAPLLAMWPLFRLDLDAFARLAVGFVVAAAACLSPWLLMTTPARVWMAGVAILAITNVALASRWVPRIRTLIRASYGRRRSGTDKGIYPWHPYVALGVGVFTAIWLVAPFLVTGGPAIVPAMLALAVVAVALPGVWRGRGVAVVLLVIGAATFAAASRFDGSFAWLQVGFQTDRYPRMFLGRVANLPAMLAGSFHYDVGTPVTLPGGATVETRSFLRGIAYAGLAILAFAMARAQRRRDANLIVVLPAAWTLLYAVLPQMHERYLLWAAATSAMLAARSFAGLLAHLMLTASSCACLLLAMIEGGRLIMDPRWGPWYRASQGLVPEIGYAIVLLAVVLMFWAMARDGARGAARSSKSHA